MNLRKRNWRRDPLVLGISYWLIREREPAGRGRRTLKEQPMHSCAILDDYQNAALSVADWSPLAGQVDARTFNEHFEDREALAKALAGFDIVVAMRERTPFDAWLFDRLPKLRLLVTTGMRNASIDLEAAAKRGVTVCGTSGSVGTTAELAWGLILACAREHHRRRTRCFIRAGGGRRRSGGG